MIDPHPIVLVAMGGHAFMQPGEAGTIEDHERNAARIATLLMTLVERDYHVVVRFLRAGGRRALITNPESLPQAIDGRAGTHFVGGI